MSSSTAELLHPKTQKLLSWIAKLIVDKLMQLERDSREHMVASQALLFVLSLAPTQIVEPDPREITNEVPDARQQTFLEKE